MLQIGTTRSGKPVSLSDQERARHIHILGSIGTGKSKLLEHMIRQDIASGRGLCLIDPHGTLYDKIEQWCASRGLDRLRRIHLLRPGDDRTVPGFNPLRAVPGEELSVRVDAMVGACAQVWGVEDLDDTPRLEKILRALFYVLAARGLTLAEGPSLLRASDPEGVRRILTANLPNPMVQLTWDELNRLPPREFAEQADSSVTRLTRFLLSPGIRRVVGQREHSLDFRAAMDNSEIVLVNLGVKNSFSPKDARMLGSLLTNDLFLTALGRDEATAKKRPFTLYLDEAYDFLSSDIERILDQTRKFGLHAVLGHQRIGQLKQQGEGIYSAVMGSTQTKIVLGGLSDDDAGIMAREIMRGDIDLEKPKRSITTPTVVSEEPFWLESESASDGTATSYSASRGSTTSQGYGSSEGASLTVEGLTMALSSSSSSASGSGESVSEGVSHTESHSETRGRSQTLRPIREERHTHFYSLEESFHLAQLKLRNLPDRAAIVKRRGQRTVRVETVEVRPMLYLPETLKRFRDSTTAQSPYVVSIEVAEGEIRERQAAILHRKPDEPEEEFWHEE